ncbi:MAG: Na+/H+ antiporter subunit E [Burkholderiaceae bacterium]|jgi:multicomponent K+:H+ antiporter subunit E
MRWRAVLSLFTPVLLALWLLLNDTLAPRQWLFGLLLAVLVLLFSAKGRLLQARPRRALLALSLLGHVCADIVHSNFMVAGIVFRARRRPPNSQLMQIPLELRDPHGLAMLACIITATPGTVWAGLSADGAVLTLHVLDLHDEQAWIRTIKERYEQPLKEIFE